MFENLPSEEIERRIRLMDLPSSTVLMNTTTHYDPIFTPLLTSAFAGAGFSIGTATTLATVTSAIATTSLIPGLQRFP